LTTVTGWFFKGERRVWKIGALALALLIWCWGSWQERSATRLTILPLRGGWATYFDAPGTKSDLLINCGDARSVESLTKPFLRAQGVNRLQGLLLTHGESRYVGGAGLVADLFSVPRVYASSARFRSPAYRSVLEQFSRAPRRLQTIGRGERLGPWTILHPEPNDHFAQADDNAVVLLGKFDGIRVLLLSDLGRPGQIALLERTPGLRADIIVTGLPSQGDAACDVLLDTAQPRAIIVAESEFPASERASARLRERLARRNVPVIYTRSDGAATVEFRESRWEIRTMNGIRIRSSN
jgi:competence protein ComEC